MAPNNRKNAKELNSVEGETTASLKSADIDPTLVRRVTTKLAKTLYLQNAGKNLPKRSCKIVALKIDEILQGYCTSEEDYKEKAVACVRGLDRSRGKGKVNVLKHLDDKEDCALVKSINRFCM